MPVSREEIRRIAELARLSLSEEELDRLHAELDGILGHLDVLRELGDVAAETDPAEGMRLRDDEPGVETLHQAPVELAPEWRNGFFTVPRLPAMGGPEDEEPPR